MNIEQTYQKIKSHSQRFRTLQKATQSGPACWAPLLNFGSPVWRLTGAASVQTVSQERVNTPRCQHMRFNGSNTSLSPET